MPTDANLPQRIKSIYNTCSPEEQQLLIQILEEISETGHSDTYENLWLQDYKEIPVDKYTFLTSSEYLGLSNNNGQSIYPAWMDMMLELERTGNKYYEIVLTGATRTGKTSTAVSDAAYLLYKTMCLRNPQEYFGLKAATRISLFFFNITATLAKGVAFKEFSTTLSSSPWFNSHGSWTRSENDPIYVPEGGLIEITYGSDSSQALGKAAIGVIFDECNFSRAGIRDITKSKKLMKEKYDTLVARVTGTFVKHGEVFGRLYIISSKNSDSDFMEDYVQAQQRAGNTHMYIFDKPQWEVWPASKYSSDEKFRIAVGNRYLKSHVLTPDEDTPEGQSKLIEQGYQIVNVPMDNKTRFMSDFDIALRDIAGISVAGSIGFITQAALTPVVSRTRHNPFYTDTIEIGANDNQSIEQFFHIEEVPKNLRGCFIAIHLDLAEVSDRQGISAVCVDGTRIVKDGDNKDVAMPFFRQLFVVGVEAPKGERMSFQKVVNFLLWLRRNGFNIQIVSTDQYQSSYMRETLSQLGFNTAKISVDRSEDPYIGLKNVICDQRIELIKNQLQEDELVNLQYSNGKFDHLANGGSKDLSDSLCGAVYDLVQNQINPAVQPKSVINIMSSVNGSRGGRSFGFSNRKF